MATIYCFSYRKRKDCLLTGFSRGTQLVLHTHSFCFCSCWKSQVLSAHGCQLSPFYLEAPFSIYRFSIRHLCGFIFLADYCIFELYQQKKLLNFHLSLILTVIITQINYIIIYFEQVCHGSVVFSNAKKPKTEVGSLSSPLAFHLGVPRLNSCTGQVQFYLGSVRHTLSELQITIKHKLAIELSLTGSS